MADVPRARAENIRSRLGLRVGRFDPGILLETVRTCRKRRVLATNPARITNALRNGERITAKIIAKATEHLRVQVIPFWKAKNTLYHLFERI